MHFRRYALIIGMLLSCALAHGQTNTITPVSALFPGIDSLIGERITYHLYWGYVPVGTSVSWMEWADYHGRRVIAIRLRTISNKFVEKLYPVDDIIESLVDPETFLPLQFTKNVSEGKTRHYETTTFDHANLLAFWESRLSGKKRVFKLTPGVRDIPTLMYYLRTHTFKPGTQEQFSVMADDKIYDLKLNVGKRERVDLPQYGSVLSIKTEPEAAFEGLFVRRGKMWVWVSSDKRSVATQVVVTVPVATVRAILWRIEGPGTDFWVTKRVDVTRTKGPSVRQ